MLEHARPSTRMSRIKPSPSSAAAQRARDLRSQGRDVISLTTGEPDFDTPPHVVEAAYQAMLAGETRYTPVDGTADLKRAIADKFRRDNGLEYDKSEIIASNGGKQVIFQALFATLEPEDEVVIPTPSWVSYPDMTLLAGARSVLLPCGPGDGFKLTPDRLDAALNERSRWLILNSPCNPSGAIYTGEELDALATVLERYPRVLVLSDDIYEHIRFDGATFATLASVRPDMKERILTVNGVSKAYAMTGWRLGYAGGPRWLIKEMAKLQSQSTSNPSSISQAAAVAALDGPQDFLAEQVAAYQDRRDLVLRALEAVEGLRVLRPHGAFYVYADCDGLIGRRTPAGAVLCNDNEVGLHLLDAVGVATVHGEAFGLSPYLRLSTATDSATLSEACRRIASAISDLR